MVAEGATPDIMSFELNWPAAIAAVAVPWPWSSVKPLEQTNDSAAQLDWLETRPAISGLLATTPVSTSAMVIPAP
jgi:hypothetical protein